MQRMKVQGRRRSQSVPPRPPLDLKEAFHTASTVSGRQKASKLWNKWLEEQNFPPLSLLLSNLRQANEALAEFVQFCYDAEAYQGLCIDALFSTHDEFYECARMSNLPWRRVTAWQRGSPPELRHAVPGFLFRVIRFISLLWRWHHFAATTMIMFHGVARPGEAFGASWNDMFMPRILESWDTSQWHVCITRIREPKTRWRGARPQFLLLEDPEVINYLAWLRSSRLNS